MVGVTTGLSCACQVANIYLLGMDSAFRYTFRYSCQFLKRFIDDVLVVIDTSISTHSMLEELNSFSEDINRTNHETDSNTQVTFLDLNIDISSNELHFSPHRKKLATYGYTPYDSCHSRSTLHGIVATECVRLLRTNSHETSFTTQIVFLPW